LVKDLEIAKQIWSDLSGLQIQQLKMLLHIHKLSVAAGDLIFLDRKWYVTHSGLLNLARRMGCHGVRVEPIREFCDASASRWIFKATAFRSSTCKGFAGFGDADPSNVSPLVRGAEMRVAETRAVNRALRKAYGIGLCSVEELGSAKPSPALAELKKPVQPANGNYRVPKVRDRLCQLIRQHQLDPILVKAYALDFCGTKTLREASREQIESFVNHLAESAEKDRNALLCQLNNYSKLQEGAA
jgi:hypothetical protein